MKFDNISKIFQNNEMPLFLKTDSLLSLAVVIISNINIALMV